MATSKITSKFLPPSHKFFAGISEFLHERHGSLANLFNRYMWRYRLASSFIKIEADKEMSTTTLLGYSECMRLFLAFGAYDEIRNAEKIINKIVGNKETYEIKNTELALRIRSLEVLKETFSKSDYVVRSDYYAKLEDFYRRGNNDVMLVATAFRNMFVHGDMTAAGAGLTNSTKRKIIKDLSNAVLHKADEISLNLIQQYVRSRAAELMPPLKQNNKHGRKTLSVKK